MRDQSVRGSAAVAAGEQTWARLCGPRYRRVLPDIYQPASTPVDLRTRSFAAYCRVSDRGGVLAGYSAAELHRVRCAPPDAPAEVLVGWDLPPRADLRVHRDTLRSDEICTVAGCRVTTPQRTAYDLARWLALVEGVVTVDALAGRFGFDLGELRTLRRRGARNGRQLDRVIELANPESESPMETRLRLLLVLAGLPAPAVQFPVPDAKGNVLGWLDLAYREVLLGLEYDGEHHHERHRAVLDRRRDARMAELGWQVLRLTASDIRVTPDRTVTLVRRVLAARRTSTR